MGVLVLLAAATTTRRHNGTVSFTFPGNGDRRRFRVHRRLRVSGVGSGDRKRKTLWNLPRQGAAPKACSPWDHPAKNQGSVGPAGLFDSISLKPGGQPHVLPRQLPIARKPSRRHRGCMRTVRHRRRVQLHASPDPRTRARSPPGLVYRQKTTLLYVWGKVRWGREASSGVPQAGNRVHRRMPRQTSGDRSPTDQQSKYIGALGSPAGRPK